MFWMQIALFKVMFLTIASSETYVENPPVELAIRSDDWNYENTSNWQEHYPSCGGEHQSPINLELAASEMIFFPKFDFNNYHQVSQEMITNNGHTLMMSFTENHTQLPYITGGGLADRFDFVQLHFHWGGDSAKGSEHHINSQTYPAELHMVHYNTKYPNFEEAKQFQDGLAVLGIMMELSHEDNPSIDHLEHFEEIIDPTTGQTSLVAIPVTLAELLPTDTSSFFRYNGSLTTPSCNEDVIWTVFDTPIGISERQLEQFRQLKDEEGQPLENNFRPVQELHDRQVLYRPKPSVLIPIVMLLNRT